MGLARELDAFIKDTNQRVFIEAEGKPEKIDDFIREYNSKYGQAITSNTDGIIQLKPSANKWSLELRLYLYFEPNFSEKLSVTHNNAYRENYSYRVNDNKLIRELFNMGYRIGLN